MVSIFPVYEVHHIHDLHKKNTNSIHTLIKPKG